MPEEGTSHPFLFAALPHLSSLLCFLQFTDIRREGKHKQGLKFKQVTKGRLKCGSVF